MPLIDLDFGGDDETSTNQRGKTRQIGINEGSTTSTSGTQNLSNRELSEALTTGVRENLQTTGRQDTTLLDARQRRNLDEIISDQRGISGGLRDLSGVLQQRGLGAEADLESAITPQIAEARRQGEIALGRTQAALQLESGGRGGNSVAQLLGLGEREDLETRLAGLRGSLALQAREAGSRDLAASSATLGAAGGALADTSRVAEVLKGALGSSSNTVNTNAERNEVSSRLQNILDASDQTSTQANTQNIVETLLREAELAGRTSTDEGFSIGLEL